MEPLPRTRAVIEHGTAEGLHLGAQIYVSRAGDPVADLAIGEARVGVALRPDSLMLWMSAVKPVMAVAIAQQWERGHLALDDRVAQHVPEFGVKGKDPITIRHVLTHTGGFRQVAQWSSAPWDDIIAEICATELEADWVPGKHAGYHVASGWYVLGEIIRRLDGRPYNRYAREEIFEPLGLHDTWIGMPADRHSEYGDRIVPVHYTTDAGIQPHPFRLWSGSAEACALCRPGGSGRGPIRELGKFYEVLLHGGAHRTERVLSPQTVEAFTTRHTVGMFDRTFNVPLDRGLGVVVDSKHHGEGSEWYGPQCSPRTFGHGGFVSSVGFADPEHRLVVAVIFNGMTDAARHQARMRATLTAIYEDLGITADR